jgi:hypothetical protein
LLISVLLLVSPKRIGWGDTNAAHNNKHMRRKEKQHEHDSDDESFRVSNSGRLTGEFPYFGPPLLQRRALEDRLAPSAPDTPLSHMTTPHAQLALSPRDGVPGFLPSLAGQSPERTALRERAIRLVEKEWRNAEKPDFINALPTARSRRNQLTEHSALALHLRQRNSQPSFNIDRKAEIKRQAMLEIQEIKELNGVRKTWKTTRPAAASCPPIVTEEPKKPAAAVEAEAPAVPELALAKPKQRRKKPPRADISHIGGDRESAAARTQRLLEEREARARLQARIPRNDLTLPKLQPPPSNATVAERRADPAGIKVASYDYRGAACKTKKDVELPPVPVAVLLPRIRRGKPKPKPSKPKNAEQVRWNASLVGAS